VKAPIGEILDSRYRIVGQVGSGAMGIVYRAVHMGLGRSVAIKVVHPNLAQSSEVLARFEREAFTAGRVQHPNSVQVSDFGRLKDGRLYLVMELLNGRILAEELEKYGRIEPGRALRIIRHVLAALAHAHQREVVHRDIKPDNVILVDQNGDPDFAKLLDFSIAKLIGPSASLPFNELTNTGVAVGTPAYVAPEQALGDTVDGRTDLYSVTAMLYEMLTGTPPFDGDKPIDVLRAHLDQEPPTLSSRVPEISTPALEEIIRRGMSKRREERYASAEEFLSAIDIVLSMMEPPTFVQPFSMDFMNDPKSPTKSPKQFVDKWMTLAKQYPARTLGGVAVLLLIIAMLLPGKKHDESGTVAAPTSAHTTEFVRELGEKPQPTVKELVNAGDQKPDVIPEPDTDDPGVVRLTAEKLIAADQHERATKYLLKHRALLDADPPALMLLGHAACRSGKVDEGLKAYKTALELQPDLSNNPHMRRVLLDVGRSEDLSVAIPALQYAALTLYMRDAREIIAEKAEKSADPDARRRFREVAQAGGIDYNQFQSLRLDLEQQTECSELQATIAKLAKLKDRRAVPLLEKSLEPRLNEDEETHKKRQHCMRVPVDKAMRQLRN
jgi:serine/threonine protein kinase